MPKQRLSERLKRRRLFLILLWEWWRWVEMKVGFWIRDFQVLETEVLGDSLLLTTDYLSIEVKVVVVNSKLESVETKSSKLRKDLIFSMDETNKANEKIRELNEALQMEKALVV
nr:hypothetical protein CFP56_33329 [Quercus suber]